MIDDVVTPSFRLSEFLVSDMAVRRGIDNTPSATQLANVRNILAPGMQEIRDILGLPIFITSGFRSVAVNKAVGGSKDSQHCDGLAADFKCPAMGLPSTVAKFLLVHGSRLPFDQLIMEGGWVHVSFVSKDPRHDVLTAHFTPAGVTYTIGL